MTGIYRYVPHESLPRFLAQGWQWKWWCCGDCQDGEAP